MVWLTLLGVVVLLGLAVALASVVGSARFRARYGAEKEELLRHARSAAPRSVDPAAVAALPPPVRRYLEVAGVAGATRPRLAVLEQRGALRTAADKPWMPFEAEQVYSMDPPGFVWLARARMMPLLHLWARDRFVDGTGNMLISLLGLVTVADARGAEIDQGAGLRFWGEIIAFPEMVLDPHLRWEAVDERRARMVARHGGLELAAVVEFDEAGMPVATHAERYRDLGGGRSALTPWSGFSRDWKLIDGRRFPASWASVWHLPEGDLEAVRMEILRVRTE